VIASVLQIIGLTIFSIGIGLVFIPAGIAVFGASCVLVGIALERGKF
jgi:hypothetical protein